MLITKLSANLGGPHRTIGKLMCFMEIQCEWPSERDTVSSAGGGCGRRVLKLVLDRIHTANVRGRMTNELGL